MLPFKRPRTDYISEHLQMWRYQWLPKTMPADPIPPAKDNRQQPHKHSDHRGCASRYKFHA